MASSEAIYALANPVVAVLLVGYFAKITPLAEEVLKEWKRTNDGIVEDCRERMRARGLDDSKILK